MPHNLVTNQPAVERSLRRAQRRRKSLHYPDKDKNVSGYKAPKLKTAFQTLPGTNPPTQPDPAEPCASTCMVCTTRMIAVSTRGGRFALLSLWISANFVSALRLSKYMPSCARWVWMVTGQQLRGYPARPAPSPFIHTLIHHIPYHI